jgi:hypothetical protein
MGPAYWDWAGWLSPMRLFRKEHAEEVADLVIKSSLLSESHHVTLMFVLEKIRKLMDEINAADATY